MDKVIITGATGVLAKHISVFLKRMGYSVYGISRQKNIADSTFTTIYTSNYSIASLCHIIDEVTPQMIVNTVGEINVKRCQDNLVHAYQANFVTASNLNKAIEKHNIYLVHISTDHVYSKPGFSSEQNVQCVNHYAFTKLLGETAFDFSNSLVLRTNYVTTTKTNSTFLDQVLRLRTEKDVVNLYQNVMFNPTTPLNLSQNIYYAFQKKPTGTFNLGTKEGWSKADFVFSICRRLNFNLSYRLIDYPKTALPKPLDMRMNTKKSAKTGFLIPTNNQILDQLEQEINCGF